MNRGHQLDEIDRLREDNERLREELQGAREALKEEYDVTESHRVENERLWEAELGSRTAYMTVKAENERLRAALGVVRRSFANEYGPASDKGMGPGWSKPIFDALTEEKA